MLTQAIKLIDTNRTVVATAQVVEQDEKFNGQIDLHLMPLNIQQKFTEYEEIVNGQMFSFLDEIEEQISELRLKIRFETGEERIIEDLQIYPSTRRISFIVIREIIPTASKEPVLV